MSNIICVDALCGAEDSSELTPTELVNMDGTMIDAFLANVAKTPDEIYMTQPMGGDKDNLVTYTFAETLDAAKRMASYLKSLDFPEKSQIAVCSKNCAWWIISDIAIWFAGHISVPIYPTLTADTVSYVLEHSESKLLFIGKLDAAPWAEMKGGVPDGFPTVSFPLSPEGEYDATWNDLMEKNEPIDEIATRVLDEMATIIYTSGSTGRPKGVMHSFNSMMQPTIGLCKLLNVSNKDRFLSYLPLAHGMERWCAQCTSMVSGMCLFFADSLKTFVQDLQRAKPTLFLSVPRLWTKFQQGVHQKMPPKKLNILFKIPLLNRVVKKKLLVGLGLDSVRFAGSGSAPIPKELIEWYQTLGLNLSEGYGMTENFNYSHISKPGRGKPGTVGETYDDVDHRISEEGEIQVKSPGCMTGYYKNEEATKETLTEDGYIRTGDKGVVDSMGRLSITGRIKEIFKTSKGKYVAPAPIETKLINHPKIELACVGGSSFPQPHAVVQLSEQGRGEPQADIEKELTALLATMNPTLDGHEQLEFIAVVSDEWLPENGFLTPTQKIKRAKIEETYSPNNEEWYGSKKKVIFM